MSQGLTLKQVSADSVPYGAQITVRGGRVWIVTDHAGNVLGTYGTATEARSKHSLDTKKRTPAEEYINRARRWGTSGPWAKRFREKHNLDEHGNAKG